MSAQDSVTLKCESCGHEWEARNTPGKARQCSKCRSRKIGEAIKDTRRTEEGMSSELIARSLNKGTASCNEPQAASIMNDPEVREKLKELEIVKLERQIARERGCFNDERALKVVTFAYKTLIRGLYGSGFMDDEFLEFLESVCPWCGRPSILFIDDEESYGWKCQHCGKVVN
jgi:ribosomal protein L37AE/L43A